MLSELKEAAKVRYVSAYDVSMIHAALGDKDQAFAWLAKAAPFGSQSIGTAVPGNIGKQAGVLALWA